MDWKLEPTALVEKIRSVHLSLWVCLHRRGEERRGDTDGTYLLPTRVHLSHLLMQVNWSAFGEHTQANKEGLIAFSHHKLCS